MNYTNLKNKFLHDSVQELIPNNLGRYNKMYIKRVNGKLENPSNEPRFINYSKMTFTKKTIIRSISSSNYKVIVFTEGGKKLVSEKGVEIFGEIEILIQIEPKSQINCSQIVWFDDISTPVLNNSYVEINYTLYEEKINSISQDLRGKDIILTVVDELSLYNLEDDFCLYNLERDDTFLLDEIWRRNNALTNIKFCLVESVWRGKNGTWTNEINPNLGSAVIALIKFCKKNKIPLIYVNKEDPVSFNRFGPIAPNFDVVFSTDSNCVEKYKDMGIKKVFLYNYFVSEKKYSYDFDKKKEITDKLIFAGSWYPNFRERTIFFENLIQSHEIDIVERHKNHFDAPNNFPSKYRKNVIDGSLKPHDLNKLISQYKFVLNLNSSSESNSLFARRIVEMICMGKIVVSNYTPSLERLKNYNLVYDKNNNIDEIINKIDKNTITEEDLIIDSLNCLVQYSTDSFKQLLSRECDMKFETNLAIKVKIDNKEDAINLIKKLNFQSKKNVMLVIDSEIDEENLIFLENYHVVLNNSDVPDEIPIINFEINKEYDMYYFQIMYVILINPTFSVEKIMKMLSSNKYKKLEEVICLENIVRR